MEFRPEPKDRGAWKTCDDCPNTSMEQQEVVMHADRWDSAKRMNPPDLIAYEINHAKHKGNWVVIPYKWKVCGFDNNPVMPEGLHHHCPWHGKEIKKESNWWE